MIFSLLVGLIVIWTGLFIVKLAPLGGSSEPMTGLVIMMALVYWAVVAVPLGIFALIAKPR